MTRTIRRSAVAVATVFAIALGGASLAWACTRQPTLTITPGFGKAGSQAQVTGKQFKPAEPVEIRWNGGEVIGRAVGSDFTVAVTIPQGASEGVYYVVATAPGTRGQVPFQVRSAASRGSDPAQEEGSDTSGSADGSDGAGASESGSSSATTSGGSGGGSNGASGGGTGELGFAEEGQPAPAPSSSPASAAASSAQASPANAGTDGRSSTSPAADERTVGRVAAAPAAAAVAGEDEAAPSARSVTADLWSGFSAGDAGSLTAPGADSPAPNGTPPLAYGLILLSVGILALGLGFGAAELGRRRAVVRPQA